eukprot:TRINITY_DN2137_c0_g1_i3.p1 TRINITY_DN2137_c0_g1~~TRINITY_DN2137_c0_g1_i3.p1  ORF type:complete len:412 (+),score=9.35 TRINITY_DN2137_c0_g1_i3:57-1238(+)
MFGLNISLQFTVMVMIRNIIKEKVASQQRQLYGYGFESASLIQAKVLPPLLNRKDIVAQGPFGADRVATGIIGALQFIDQDLPQLQGIILCPTRELAYNVAGLAKSLGAYMKVDISIVTGGVSIKEQLEKLAKAPPHLLIATPGRLLDLINKGSISVDKVSLIILEETDELLNRGFAEDVENILKAVPSSKVQMCVFSEAVTMQVIDFSKKYVKNPACIKVHKRGLTLEGVKQYYVKVPDESTKLEVLYDLLSNLEFTQVPIYVNSSTTAESIAQYMRGKELSLPLSLVHSSMSAEEREKNIKEFRTGATRIIILTDIPEAEDDSIWKSLIVLNYDLPELKENYIRRTSRSSIHGRKGIAINLVAPNSIGALSELEKFYATRIDPLPHDLSSI